MPTLEWIGKDKVINHHQEVPFRILDKKYTFNAGKLREYDYSRGQFACAQIPSSPI